MQTNCDYCKGQLSVDDHYRIYFEKDYKEAVLFLHRKDCIKHLDELCKNNSVQADSQTE